MTPIPDLGRGVNFGGWISQAPNDEDHRRSFVTQSDFRRIADWGFDNVRLPFDHPLLCPTDDLDNCNEAGFAWLDTAFAWAEEAGLKLILDMHSLPGFTFMDPINNPNGVSSLFTEKRLQDVYFGLWQTIARRYAGRFPAVVFELANEIVAPDPQLWNDLAAGAVRAIREVEPERPIVVGSNCWNVCGTFSDLAPVDDPNIIYNFHFYNPFTFTHQRASWSPEMVFYDRAVKYPGNAPGMREAAARARDDGKEWVAKQLESLAGFFEDRVSDQTHLEELMQPSFTFAKAHGVPLYCGEFGAISHAGLEDRLNWFRDVLTIFRRHNVAWSLWSYKGMAFGVVDGKGNVISEEMLNLLRGVE